RMAVREVAPGAPHDRADVLQAAMFASAENPVDPMEKALHEAATEHAVGLSKFPNTLIKEYPLSRGLLAMSRVIRLGDDDAFHVFAKGAPEAIAQLCRIPGKEIAALTEPMARRGLRMLGVARSRIPSSDLPDSQRAFTFEFLGLVGLEDPVRPS